MNHDLIKQLQALTPTEGEWHAVDFAGHINIMDGDYYEANDLLDGEESPNDYIINGKLAALAPTMRTEILAMANEIEELREGVTVLMESHNKKDAEIKDLNSKLEFWDKSWDKIFKVYDQINNEITPQPK